MTRLLSALAVPFFCRAALLYGVEPKISREAPAYFADNANSEVTPLPIRLDLTTPGFLKMEGGSLTIEIAWENITSLSYAKQVTANNRPPLARLLTVGFFDQKKIHHNAAVLLSDLTQVKLLPQLEARSGCKIGKY